MNFIDRIANLGPLSSTEKKRLAIAGVAVASLLGVAWWIAKRPSGSDDKRDYGIKIDDLCVNATITDPERLRRAIEDTYDTQVAAGNVDPLTMTSGFFGKIGPQCHVYPKPARSPKEAEFFLIVFRAFLEQLENDGLITENEGGARMFEAMAWATRAGWKPAQEIGPLLGDA